MKRSSLFRSVTTKQIWGFPHYQNFLKFLYKLSCMARTQQNVTEWAGASSKSSELLELATFLGAGAGAPLLFEKSSWSGSSLLFQPSEAPRSFFAKTFF